MSMYDDDDSDEDVMFNYLAIGLIAFFVALGATGFVIVLLYLYSLLTYNFL